MMSNEARAKGPAQVELDIPEDALLTRGFVKRLPGYKHDQREIELRPWHGITSGVLIWPDSRPARIPNWSGEGTNEGRPAQIKVWNDDFGNRMQMRIKTSERESQWTIKEEWLNHLGHPSQISYKEDWFSIPLYPLVPNARWSKQEFSGAELILYFQDRGLDIRRNGGQIYRVQDVTMNPWGNWHMTEHDLENDIYRTMMQLKEIMLHAKSTTP